MTQAVALTGGIGCGKSTVAAMFADLKVPVIIADEIAKALLLTDHDLIQAAISYFGDRIAKTTHEIDRYALRKCIFQDKTARVWLEQQMHPKILSAIRVQINTLTVPYCIVEIPLLIETGSQRLFDKVIVVDVPLAIQKQRALARDDTSEDDINAILASQTGRTERLYYADFVIENSHDLANTHSQVKKVHSILNRGD